jgi:hypothetical protein
MSDDEFDRIASIPPAKVKDLYAAGQLAAKMLHADPGRYAELLATLQNNGHKRLTDWDRHVKRILSEAVKRGREAERNAASAQGFEVDKNGKIQATAKNVRLALAEMGVVLRYDTFRDRVIVDGLDGYGPILDDHTARRLWLSMGETYGFNPQREFFQAVVEDAAYQERFTPVRDYLDGLTWDRKPRIDTWLSVYGGAEDSVYTRAVGRLMLVAAVRRQSHPGSKFDEMLVAEGDQGAGKSEALRTLVPDPEWFTDSVPLNADDKRLIEQTAGKWIVEVADLHGASKAEIEAVKAMMSRNADRSRLAFGRMTVERPRQFVIFGTTNDDRYLADQTGNRRFWPVKVNRFDVDGLRWDRDQLWAEAAVAERSGESIRLDPSLYPVAVREQEQRVVKNPFIDVLAEALQERDGVLYQTTAYDLLGIRPQQRTAKTATTLKKALEELGYRETNRREHGANVTAYAKGGPVELRRFEVDESLVGRVGLRYREG